MNTSYLSRLFLLILTAGLLLSACSTAKVKAEYAAVNETQDQSDPTVDIEFTLQTLIDHGKLAYIGIGGDIDHVINPDLNVKAGSVVRVILVNGDGMQHDLFLPDFDAKTGFVNKVGEQSEIVFTVQGTPAGAYVYYCTVPGHRQAGQEGKLIVKDA